MPRRLSSEPGKPVKRERRPGQGRHRDPHESERVVVTRDAVGVEYSAARAVVDEGPLALVADVDGYRGHRRPAVRRPVTWSVVQVPAPQAGRAVVTVRRTRCVSGDIEAAVDAAEGTDASAVTIAVTAAVTAAVTVAG